MIFLGMKSLKENFLPSMNVNDWAACVLKHGFENFLEASWPTATGSGANSETLRG